MQNSNPARGNTLALQYALHCAGSFAARGFYRRRRLDVTRLLPLANRPLLVGLYALPLKDRPGEIPGPVPEEAG